MTELGLFKDILHRYRFRHEIGGETQLLLINSKKRVLKNILKQSGAYGFLFGIVLALFFLIRKKGLFISIKACSIIITTAVTTIIVSSILSGALILKPVITEMLFPQEELIEPAPLPPVEKAANDKTDTLKELPKVSVDKSIINQKAKIAPVESNTTILKDNEKEKIEVEKEAARLKKEKEDAEEKRRRNSVNNIPNL